MVQSVLRRSGLVVACHGRSDPALHELFRMLDRPRLDRPEKYAGLTRGRRVSGKGLELDLRDLRSDFLLGVGGEPGQSSPQQIVGFLIRLLPRPPVKRSLEREPDAVNVFGVKAQPASLAFPRLEKLVQKCSAVAL